MAALPHVGGRLAAALRDRSFDQHESEARYSIQIMSGPRKAHAGNF
jgi:hypothetical protein